MVKAHKAEPIELRHAVEELRAVLIERDESVAVLRRRVTELEEEVKRERNRYETAMEWLKKSDETKRVHAAIIETLNPDAVAKLKGDHAFAISMKVQQIDLLKEHLDRCLGWIDAQNQKHPLHHIQQSVGSRPDGESRVLTGDEVNRRLRS